ncbi:hypothetical protein [Herminiimonas sp. CN]|uniref:hypothetical protein n=1 Tax=Herminiimonas sp. CN TaxID=1349818 RepID=UPI00047350EA|nr:hypothetical protein [Herminiimonas sp. CN]
MNFIDAIQAQVPAAIGPLENLDTGKSVFYATVNGTPILKHGKFGTDSSFDTEEEAISFAKKYLEYALSKGEI